MLDTFKSGLFSVYFVLSLLLRLTFSTLSLIAVSSLIGEYLGSGIGSGKTYFFSWLNPRVALKFMLSLNPSFL